MTTKSQVENDTLDSLESSAETSKLPPQNALDERLNLIEESIKALKGRLDSEIGELHERVEDIEYEGRDASAVFSTVLGVRFVLSPDAFSLAYTSLYESSIFQMHAYPPVTEEDNAYYAEKCSFLMKFLFDVLDLTEEEEMMALTQVFTTWVEWQKSNTGQVPKTPPPLTTNWFGYLLENVSIDTDYEDED